MALQKIGLMLFLHAPTDKRANIRADKRRYQRDERYQHIRLDFVWRVQSNRWADEMRGENAAADDQRRKPCALRLRKTEQRG